MTIDGQAAGFPRVLHLEDNSLDAELIGRLLGAEWPACSIRDVRTKDEFVGAVKSGGFDLILSDFSLPQFDGLSALALARRLDSTTPFIFMSGTIGEENAVKALQRGAIDYVIKDRPGRLIPAVRRALESSRAERDRQKIENELRESQERFLQLAEQSSDIFWFVSFAPERVTYVSPSFERIWGISAETLYHNPRAWESAVHPDDRNRVESAYNACVEGTADGFDEVYRLVRPNGQERWISDKGSIIRNEAGVAIRLCGIAKDISEHRKAELRVREQADLLDKARDVIVVTNLDQEIIYWNHGAEHVLGHLAADAVGRDGEFIFGTDGMARIESVHSADADGQWHGPLRLRNANDKEVILDCSVTLICDERGRPKSLLILGTDITERMALEQQFLRSQRLDSVGLLAGGIAHDLNNALAPILMGAGFLQHLLTDPEPKRMLSIIETSANHGAALVRQILTFARGAGGERAKLQLGPIVRDVVELMQETLPKSISLRTEIGDEIYPIESDSTHLSQVLVNLCVNGRDAMPEGGELTISVQNVQVDPALAHCNSGAKLGPHVLITLKDTGTGIPQAIVDRIFDPFFTTKGPKKGTGLGLSTVLGIVKSHGGFIKVDTSVGRGTSFGLYFPACEDVPAPAAPSATERLSPGHGEKILIIDDEENILTLVKALAEAAGYNALVADGGAKGIALFQQARSEIALVITDMMMPDLQGGEVIRRLRAIDPSVRIIAMSGLFGAESGVGPLPDQVAVLAKPMSYSSLLRTIDEVLGRPA